MTDIEIAENSKKKKIITLAKELGVEKNFESYGSDKGKIDFSQITTKEKGKLVLVTAISPTPYGEGKTTVSIGLNDGLRQLHKNSLAVLREPSLGPVFGTKGGATGGGYAQVIPMDDINLHFTGDFHAITSANNLISAAIDNHLYFGNKLSIDKEKICFHRCLDINDRALRHIQLENRKESFNITAASEMMSILCLANDLEDLKERLGNILLALNTSGEPIYAKDLKLEGALATLLKDAIKPNLVQSLENNPILLHGGPFANIAHGCNSVIATRLGLQLADYVITEAGFGSDLGAEKFFNIKCRSAALTPNAVVLVVTTKALKHQGGISSELIQKESLKGIQKGLANLEVHLENMHKFTPNIIVALNQYQTDTPAEIALIRRFVQEKNYAFSTITAYEKGGIGAISLAEEVIKMCNQKPDFHLLYPTNLPLEEKIKMITKEIYHTTRLKMSEEIKQKLKKYETMGYQNFPICMAKTQYSISDNPKQLGYPKDYEITITDVNIYTGAQFVVVYLGNMMTMPGLSSTPNYEKIDIDATGKIKGLF